MHFIDALYSIGLLIIFSFVVKNAEPITLNDTSRNYQNHNENSYEDFSYANSFRDSVNEKIWTETENPIKSHAKIGALLIICNFNQ